MLLPREFSIPSRSYPPLEGEGRLALSEAKCETGWGGEATERGLADHHSLLRHPTPLAARATLPLQGRVRKYVHLRILATHCARGLQIRSPQNRGRREDRVRAAPAISRAKAENKGAHEHTGSAEAVRPSLRNGFTAYFVLSLATGLFVTITRVMRERHHLRDAQTSSRI